MNADIHTSAPPPPPCCDLQAAHGAQEKPHCLLDFFLTLVLPCPKRQRLRLRQNKVDRHWEPLTHTATHPVVYRTPFTPHLHRHSNS